MTGNGLDLDAYMARIGYSGPRTPTAQVLRDLHTAQVFSIPFENLSIQMREPISLDIADMMAKMVHSGRGGYCFELNGLFSAVLEALGFQVDLLAARVRYGSPLVAARLHQLLLVTVGDQRWLADVGFGGNGIVAPIPFELNVEIQQYGETFRLKREDEGLYVLEALLPDGWLDLYAFTLEPLFPIDFEPANHYMSTSPVSPFCQTRIVAQPNPTGRTILVEHELKVRDNGETTTAGIDTDAAYLSALRTHFGIDLPDGTRFKPLNKPPE
ncbi:MAG: arylamine N-acetyltransferase [Rhodospirillales bacterium]|nr:arylamine N-acetyltransferase [Rhodospirillales bacterium]